MLPLLASVKVTDPAGEPELEVTCAWNVTQESWATDVAEAVSVVLVLAAGGGLGGRGLADAVVAGDKARPTATATQLPSARTYQRISTAP
jgi:hypothetical protein